MMVGVHESAVGLLAQPLLSTRHLPLPNLYTRPPNLPRNRRCPPACPPLYHPCHLPATVAAAVAFLGEPFSWVNGLGLLVLILGVVLFNWLKYQKVKSELATAGGGTDGGEAGKLGSEEDEGAGSEVELSGTGGGGGGLSSPARAGSPTRGSGEHAVLMLGVREGFLVEDEALLHPSPRSSWRRRQHSPMAADVPHGA